MSRICIVSSGCLSSGPRVVKEADALAAAGHQVRVVVCHTLPWMAEWDARLARGRAWSYRAVEWGVRTRRRSAPGIAWSAGSRVAGRLVDSLGPISAAAELSLGAPLPAMLRLALHEPADLFIAHNLPALPVARAAATLRRVPFGFDAEDDHYGELSEELQDGPRGRAILAVMQRHLPHCAHVSAASGPMADALAQRHRIARPTVVHNVFPWADRETIDGQRLDRRSDSLSIYWYSQSLGLDRGLQDAIRAAGLLRGEFELHLRGDGDARVEGALRALADECGMAGRLHLHPQVPPDSLLSRSAEHDVGLALEQPVSDNRMRTVTNKLFFYMLGGLALAATETPGQASVLAQAPEAGFGYPPGDHVRLAAGLQRYLDDPAALQAARAASLTAARERFNWEYEQRDLTAAIEAAL